MTIPRAPAVALEPAFERLFRAEYHRVVGIAARVLGDGAAAEDVAQEAFLSLHRRGTAAEPWAAAWVCAAAVHGALNVLRGERRRSRREALAAEAAPVTDPATAAEVSEDRRVVREALRRMPVRTATVLVLRHSGLSYAEVATAMNVGQNDVGTMLRRAEAALRKEIGNAATPR